MAKLNTPAQFGKALKTGPYAWPGGYPLFFITSDGAALCFKCAKEQGKQVTDSIRTKCNDGWRIVAMDANWEDPSLYCDHCNKQIESAYADDDEAQATQDSKRDI